MITYNTLLKNRRSIRNFEDKEVPVDVLQSILKDVGFTPSANGKQPWQFVIVQDKEIIKKISDESKKNKLKEIENNATNKRFEAVFKNPEFNVFYNAPCLVLIGGEKDNMWLKEDCSLAACYFMFAATSRNLGTCWIGLGDSIKDTNLRKSIGLTENYEIVAPIILGYPQNIPSAHTNKDSVVLKWV